MDNETKNHEELKLSNGELALIRAIRRTDVSYVWQRKGAILIDKRDFATVHRDFIVFLTGGEYVANDDVRAALNRISREQEEREQNG